MLKLEFYHQQIIPIGESFEGRTILVAKLGIKQEYKKPAIFIEAGLDKQCIHVII